MKKQVLVINYHRIRSAQSPAVSAMDNRFSVTSNAFEKQLDLLLSNHVPLVTLHDLVTNRLSAPFSVAITIDDGNASDYEIAYPLLKARNIQATFFWLPGGEKNASRWEHAREMIANGFVIGSHGISHDDLSGMKPGEQQYELQVSKKRIEEKTGHPVRYFALPYGLYNSATIRLATQAGYLAVCTTDVKLNSPRHPTLIHRWNVKNNTSLKEFEAMVCNKRLLQFKIWMSFFKKPARRVLGEGITSALSVLLNK